MNADIQQIVILVATILGWVILAGAVGFSAFVFIKLYLGRDKAAGEAKKAAEAEAKEAKRQQRAKANEGKSQRVKDTTPGNAELKQRLQTKAQAPKRQEVVSRVAEVTKAAESNAPASPGMNSVRGFLDDDIDEFDFAKQKSNKAPKSDGPKQGSNGSGFPPPPPRL